MTAEAIAIGKWVTSHGMPSNEFFLQIPQLLAVEEQERVCKAAAVCFDQSSESMSFQAIVKIMGGLRPSA